MQIQCPRRLASLGVPADGAVFALCWCEVTMKLSVRRPRPLRLRRRGGTLARQFVPSVVDAGAEAGR